MVSCDSWEIFLVATKTSFCRWAMHRTIRGEKIDIVMCPSFNTLWSNPVESLCCVPCSFLCREDLTTKGNRDSVMRWIPGGPTVQINLDNWEESIIFSSSSYSMFICCSNHEAVVKWEVSVRVCVCVCVCVYVCVCMFVLVHVWRTCVEDTEWSKSGRGAAESPSCLSSPLWLSFFPSAHPQPVRPAVSSRHLWCTKTGQGFLTLTGRSFLASATLSEMNALLEEGREV